jgi:biopolymer transport protein ExbB
VFARLSSQDIEAADALQAMSGGLWEVKGRGLRGELLARFLEERSGEPQLDRSILRQQSEPMRRELRQHLLFIAVLAAVAPLLGLLGTVLGMIETFQVIAIFGTGNARAMAGGISVALVTTQAGLMVAIPGLIISGLLLRRARRMEMRLDEFTHTMDRYLKNQNQLEAAAS